MLVGKKEKCGLGNKIKNCVSCFHLSANPRVFWDTEIIHLERSKIGFSDLFDNDVEIKPPFPKNCHFYHSWRLAILPSDPVPINFAQAKKDKDSDSNGRNIDLEYGRIPLVMRDIYLKEFHKLKVKDSILEIVNNFAKNNFNDQTISVHIRSWFDLKKKKPHSVRVVNFDLNSYITEMKKFQGANFFIASDSFEVIEKLTQEFPEKISYYPALKNNFKEDLIDMLLLAKNKCIIGTNKSTFTEVAWWLGDCQAKVIIV